MSNHGLERAMWELRKLPKGANVEEALAAFIAREMITEAEAKLLMDVDAPGLIAAGAIPMAVMAYWSHHNRRLPLTAFAEALKEARQ